jgi:hydrogenase maturation protein HypF
MTAIADAATAALPAQGQSRQRLRVCGLVQGVGFRPFVHALARRHGLSGFVRNDGDGVCIEIEGPASALRDFGCALRAMPPPRARIDRVEVRTLGLQHGRGFVVADSHSGLPTTAIGADTGVCADCLREMFDPADRRYRYPFINCSHCGPRYSITRELPYDRARTSMARFELCSACAAEYCDPDNRRFHAEAIACADCGPQLWLETDARSAYGDAAIVEAVRCLRAGQIVAIKGLGGFHLACDARNAEAVARLRARKRRAAKPFAVMAARIEVLEKFAKVDAAQVALLCGAEHPVVLLDKTPVCDTELPGVAPGLSQLGVMLPYTPIHHLLFATPDPQTEAGPGDAHAPLLVMTSANPNGEPLVCGNDAARRQLAGIADAWLMHDRDIVARCDDSVMRSEAGAARFIRRARGYTPLPIALARATPTVLALGGDSKSTICLTRGADAYVSAHVGDLDGAATRDLLEWTLAHLRRTLAITPRALAHDLHPEFYSAQCAARLARDLGVPLLAVQHHHAHIAAVLAEHRLDAPVIGLALDGYGYGDDGTAWGGELLIVDGARMQRIGSLKTLALPGADRAAREPWRMAASALHALGRGDEIEQRFAAQPAAHIVAQMLERGINSPASSSLGRVFDAAAGLLGVCAHMSYEGQAAMLLESAATRAPFASSLPRARYGDDGSLDLLPLLEALIDEADVARGAACFHAALVDALADWVIAAARTQGLDCVAGGGGCWLNRRLSQPLHRRLAQAGLRLFEAERVPPNDGGLSLGQAWVAQRALFGD